MLYMPRVQCQESDEGSIVLIDGFVVLRSHRPPEDAVRMAQSLITAVVRIGPLYHIRLGQDGLELLLTPSGGKERQLASGLSMSTDWYSLVGFYEAWFTPDEPAIIIAEHE